MRKEVSEMDIACSRLCLDKANTINHQLFSLMDSLSICLVNVFNRFMWKSLTISLMCTYKEIVI